MNRILHIVLISLISFTVITCAKKDGSSSSEETDTSSSQSVTVSSSVAFGNAKFGDAKFE